MAKYGKKAQEEVKEAVHKQKRGAQREIQEEGQEPQTGHRDRPVQSAEEGGEGAGEEES